MLEKGGGVLGTGQVTKGGRGGSMIWQWGAKFSSEASYIYE